MNLLTKTTVLYLLLALAVFGIGGVTAYRMVKDEVQRETDYSLIESYYQVSNSIKSQVPIEVLKNDKISIELLDTFQIRDTQFVFTDTLAMHPLLKRQESFRHLSTTRTINGANYRVNIMDVFIELDDIEEVVVNIMTNLFLILGVVLLVFSFLISRWLFKPFKTTLKRIRGFNLKQGIVPELPETSTSEFRQLNSFLTSMLDKAGKDYRALKEFSENASHEIQTPLAIARGKLELLMETPNLNTEQVQLVHDTEASLARLSKLVEALLLLTKIDNQEFRPQKAVDISKILVNDLVVFKELAELKGIKFSSKIEPGVSIPIEPSLASVLFSNLLKNAIRHNIAGGWIEVSLDKGKLNVKNTGEKPPVPTAQLFERFQKNKQTDSSLGLGLAIVQKICEVNNLRILYDYAEGIHSIEVRF